MSDQTVFTTRGHVFHIDPESRKKWISSAEGPVGISLFFDEQRGIYRLVACDASQNVVLNSTMQTNMTFTKTSAKFGQWSDKSSGHNVYGVGFSSESDLNKFHEEFNKAKNTLKPPDSKRETESLASGIVTPKPEFSLPKDPSPVGNYKRPSSTELRLRSPSDGSPDTPTSPTFPPVPTKRDSLQDIDATVELATKPPPGADEQQVLRYESKRLKAALARSSENAKKWEAELQTLKNNNARLTAALQDSASNVSEWKVQLKAYKEESSRLKQRVHELESKREGHSESVNADLEEARRSRADAEKQAHSSQEALTSVKLELETVRNKSTEEMKALKIKNEALREECTGLQQRVGQLQEEHGQIETAYHRTLEEKEKSFDIQAQSANQLASFKSTIKSKINEIASLIDSH